MTILDQYGKPILPTAAPRRSRSTLQTFTDFLRTVRDPDSIDVWTYHRMLDDETISAAVEFIILSVVGKLGSYRHPKKKLQRFMDGVEDGMSTPLPSVAEEMLSGVAFGHSTTENVLWERDGKLVTVDLPTLPPETYEYELFRDGINAGHIKGVHQAQVGMAAKKFIGSENLIHWAHRPRFGNKYGTSRLRAAWKWWFPKEVILGTWVRTLERYQAPIALARTANPDSLVTVESGEKIPRHQYLTQSLGDLHNLSNLILDKMDEVEFLEVKRNFGPDFENWTAFANKMMFRAALMPSLLLDNGDVGSNALGNVQYEFYRKAIWTIRNQIAKVLVDQWVRPLIILNFGEQADGYGNFEAQLLEIDELKVWSEIFFSLIKSGIIRQDLPQDFNWMRRKLNLPIGVEPRPLLPEEGGPAGKDGLPGEAPDGLDDATPGAPQAAPKTPKTKQGRPNE